MQLKKDKHFKKHLPPKPKKNKHAPEKNMEVIKALLDFVGAENDLHKHPAVLEFFTPVAVNSLFLIVFLFLFFFSSFFSFLSYLTNVGRQIWQTYRDRCALTKKQLFNFF